MPIIVVDINTLLIDSECDKTIHLALNPHFAPLLKALDAGLLKKGQLGGLDKFEFCIGVYDEKEAKKSIELFKKLALSDATLTKYITKSPIILFSQQNNEEGCYLDPKVVGNTIKKSFKQDKIVLISTDFELLENSEEFGISSVNLYKNGELARSAKEVLQQLPHNYPTKKIVAMLDIDSTTLLREPSIVAHKTIINYDLLATLLQCYFITKLYHLTARADPKGSLNELLSTYGLTLTSFKATKHELVKQGQGDYVSKVTQALEDLDTFQQGILSDTQVTKAYLEQGIDIKYFNGSFTDYRKHSKYKIDFILEYLKTAAPEVRNGIIVMIDDNGSQLKAARKRIAALGPEYGTTFIVVKVHQEGSYCTALVEQAVEILDNALRLAKPTRLLLSASSPLMSLPISATPLLQQPLIAIKEPSPKRLKTQPI